MVLGGHRFYPRIILLSDGKATVDSTMPMEDRTTSRVQEALVIFSLLIAIFVSGQCIKFINYYTPVFRRDVLWYGDARPSVRPSVRLSVRVSVHPFSALFSFMLWHIELEFCTWLCFNVLQIKFECRQYPSIFVGVMPLLELRILKIHSFPHFSFTRFDILSWNFAYDFVLLYYRSKFECRQFLSIFVGVMPLLELRILKIHSFPHFSLTCFDLYSWNFAYDFVLLYCRSSSSVVYLRQFFKELRPFLNLEYYKYEVFRNFLLHALTYWGEILHMILFYWTSDQARVSSICVNFCWSYASFGT